MHINKMVRLTGANRVYRLDVSGIWCQLERVAVISIEVVDGSMEGRCDCSQHIMTSGIKRSQKLTKKENA